MNTSPTFVGRITTSSNARNAAYRVRLSVEEGILQITGADGDEWSWNMEEVTISRSSVDRFLLELSDERLYFLPVDARGFIADIVQKYSDTPLEPHRGWLRRRIEEAQAQGGFDEAPDLVVDDSDQVLVATDSQN